MISIVCTSKIATVGDVRIEELRRSKGMLCRGVTTVHSIKIYVFCLFCFPILRGLVYWTNEDPISVSKGSFMFVR